MFFIDLLAFKKTNEEELDTDLEKWIYSIKNMGNMNTAPKMASTGVFRHLYSTAEVAALSTRERNLYERSLRNYRDILADKETTKNRMIQERKEGREEGREASNIQHISRMRKKGYEDAFIADLLELDIEYVKQH